jgi:hypothetical protein
MLVLDHQAIEDLEPLTLKVGQPSSHNKKGQLSRDLGGRAQDELRISGRMQDIQTERDS